MGRIKSQFVKSSGHKIFENVRDKLTDDFSKNKEIVAEYANIPSKRLRNSIVGYVTRLKKQSLAEE